MITLRIKTADGEILSAGGIDDFEYLYNKKSDCIDVYKNKNYCGELLSFCGMTEKDFLEAVKTRMRKE